MKRDFDLIRDIMTDIESMSAWETKQDFTYNGFNQETVYQHIALLIEAGLIKGMLQATNQSRHVLVEDLTWSGHDFLNAMRDDNIWNKAKEHIIKPGVSFTFGILLQWLEMKGKEKLGIPL